MIIFSDIFNAPLYAITCSSIKLTLDRCNSAGLNVVKFLKSVKKVTIGCISSGSAAYSDSFSYAIKGAG